MDALNNNPAEEIEIPENEAEHEEALNAEDGSENEEQAEASAEDQDGEQEQDAPELVTIEVNGKAYEVPKDLEGAFLQNRDYTQKSQQAAEQRRALEQERAAFEEERKRDQEDFKLEAQAFSMDERLEMYKQLDWRALREQDPMEAQNHFQDYQLLQQQRADLQKQVEERKTTRSQAREADFQKRYEETERYISENIPNWSGDLENKLGDHAKELGYDTDSLKSNLSPRFIRMLHLSYLGSEASKRAATAKPSVKPQPKPLATIKAKSGTQTTRIDLKSASMDDYYKARMRGVGG